MTIVMNRDAILNADDIVMESIYVKEWDGTVNLRVMSGVARERWEDKASSSENVEGAVGRLLVECICDDDGNLIFTDADIEQLGEKACGPLINLFEKACELNTLTRMEVNQVAGNSEGDLNGS